MAIHTNLFGETYEADRDGTIFSPDTEDTCDICGDYMDDGEWFSSHGWMCASCQEEMIEEKDDE